MVSEAVIAALKGLTKEDQIHLQEPMSGYTTFRVGGPADCLIELCGREELRSVTQYLKDWYAFLCHWERKQSSGERSGISRGDIADREGLS